MTRTARPPAAGDAVPIGTTTDERYDLHRARRARLGRRLFLGGLALFLLAGATGWLGEAQRSETGRYGPVSVTVTHPQVARGGLAIHYEIRVRRPGGFTEPIRLGVSGRYLDAFDENGVSPQPGSETSDGELVVWEFDPPPGDELRVSLDARVEPDTRWRRRGHTVLYDGDRPALDLAYSTYYLP